MSPPTSIRTLTCLLKKKLAQFSSPPTGILQFFHMRHGHDESLIITIILLGNWKPKTNVYLVRNVSDLEWTYLVVLFIYIFLPSNPCARDTMHFLGFFPLRSPPYKHWTMQTHRIFQWTGSELWRMDERRSVISVVLSVVADWHLVLQGLIAHSERSDRVRNNHRKEEQK